MKRIKTAKDIKFRCHRVKRGHAAALMTTDIDIAIAKLAAAPEIAFWKEKHKK